MSTYFVFLFVAGLGYTIVDLLLRPGSTLRSRSAFWLGLLTFGLLDAILRLLFPHLGLALGLSVNLLAGAGYLVYSYVRGRKADKSTPTALV